MVRNCIMIWLFFLAVVNSFQIIIFADGSQQYWSPNYISFPLWIAFKLLSLLMVRNRALAKNVYDLVVNSFQIIIFADGSQPQYRNLTKEIVVNSFQIIIFADGSQLCCYYHLSRMVVNSFQIIIFADGSQLQAFAPILADCCE